MSSKFSSCSHSDGPCLAPPHPEIRRRIQGELLRRSERSNEQPDEAIARIIDRGSQLRGDIADSRINRGVIRPSASEQDPQSRTAIARAKASPLRGVIRAIIVLVDFTDKPMNKNNASRLKDLFFSVEKVRTGSVTEYYSDVSGGKISFTGEMVGPLRLPHKLSRYAAGNFGMNYPGPNAQTMAADALAAARKQVNFAPYDNDGNGYVDAFVVVHAGSGGEETANENDIWSLQWNLPKETEVNGVKISAFLTVPEDALMGVCAHELGHLLFGWPDLYDSDPKNGKSQGIGDWCLMAAGSWNGTPYGTTPAHPSAWCKATQGWVNIINEASKKKLELKDVKSSRVIHRLWQDGHTGKEYFLIENRQKKGYDAFLPGEGLLIWHINDAENNNADVREYRVALEQADGKNELEENKSQGDAGDPYPGTSKNTSFATYTVPSSTSHVGRDTGVSVTNISASGAVMTMDITV